MPSNVSIRTAAVSRRRPILRASTFAAAAIIALGALSACNPFGVDTHRFVIQVDSIQAPEAIGSDDTLTVRFFGGIGPNLCYSLDRVEQRREAGLLEVRFHGEKREGGHCLAQPAVLEHSESVTPPFADPFTIRVLQPEGEPLEAVVGIQ